MDDVTQQLAARSRSHYIKPAKNNCSSDLNNKVLTLKRSIFTMNLVHMHKKTRL